MGGDHLETSGAQWADHIKIKGGWDRGVMGASAGGDDTS